MSRGLALFALSLCGCLVSVNYDDSAFLCQQSISCPDEFVCRENKCVDPDTPIFPGRFRRQLTLGPLAGQTLTNFPIAIRLDSTRIDYTNAGPGGETLRFTDANGALLAHEIETWNNNGASLVWLRVPSLEPGVTIYMYWASSSPPVGPAATEVWDDDFVAVWHLDDDPALGQAMAILDSAQDRHHGAASDSMSSESLILGPLGTALYFDDADDAVTFGDKPEFELPVYTYSFWIRGDMAPSTELGNAQPIFNADDQFNFSWHHSDGGFAQSAAHRGNGVFAPAQISAELLGATWYAVGVVYDGVMLRVYLDGELSGSIAHAPPNVVPGEFAIGNDPAVVRFAGALDDVRVSKVARDQDWMAAVVSTAAEDFVTVGPLEPL